MLVGKKRLSLTFVLACTFLMQACTPIQESSGQLANSTELHTPSKLEIKARRHPNDLPRLSKSTIPDVDISPVEEDSRIHRHFVFLSGTQKSVSTTHFRIHFTTIGIDKVPRTDTNKNSIPDYVEEVAKALEYVWEVEVNYFGWPAPPPDGGLGGDERYDVYLLDLVQQGAVGFANSATGKLLVEDNPNTIDVIEERSAYSYIGIENDFLGAGITNSRTAILYQTVAHEFFHAIHFGMDGLEPLEWLLEASATWMEDEVFYGIRSFDDWLDPVFESPDTCMPSEGDLEENRWYGLWIYLRYLSENYGHSIVQNIWYTAATVDGYDVIEDALEARNLDPEKVLQRFLIALLTLDFEKGNRYPTVRLEGRVKSGETFPPFTGVENLGADYIEIRGDGELSITLHSEQLTGIVVGIANRQSAIFAMPEGSVSVNSDDYENLYLIVVNSNKVSFKYECQVVDYEVEVSNASQVESPELLLSAPNFRAPPILP